MTPADAIPIAVPIVVTLALLTLAHVAGRGERGSLPKVLNAIAAAVSLAVWIVWSWLA